MVRMQDPTPPRDDVLSHVGRNLRRLRHRAGLSQQALADAAGLSRRMIVSLEGGDTNISLSSLDRLAAALGAGFVDLVSDPDAETRRIEAVAWRGAEAGSVAMLLGSVPARRDAQLWSWTLAPGDVYRAEPDPQGWHEMVWVSAGRLRIDLAEGPVTLSAGEFVIYGSDQDYAYANDGPETARFLRVVVA